MSYFCANGKPPTAMIYKRTIAQKSSISLILIFLFLSIFYNVSAQDGQQLFSQNCASCHAVNKRLTGPALAGLESRGPWGDKEKLYAWIHNPPAFMKTDEYTQGLLKEYQTMMTPFPGLSEADIDAIVGYVNKQASAATSKTAAGGSSDVSQDANDSSDSTLLFGVLTLILAIVAFVLLQVNANLRKLADDKEGIPAKEPIPFWKNRSYITFATLILFLVGGYLTVDGAIGLGRSQNYEPVQPIFYSHKVHAGVNQISCLYCHGGAQEGKHANIPSVNICMNCHLAINEYTGEKLTDGEGNEVNGTAEIQKLYKFAGFEAGKPWDASKAKPVEWIKIHSLPDHVYFNHAQHVNAGRVACQTCHGEIQQMDEVYQFAPLSMGWCVNCHRETKVQFQENGFYSIYEKYHDAIKNGTMDSVTVEQIGGTECQKCHY